MARRRFFVDSFQQGYAVISGEDAKHLVRVLRAHPGQQFELSDNRSVHLAEATEVRPGSVRFRLLEPVQYEDAGPAVTLVAALIKFDRFEWMIEKATELGVAAIQPVEACRTEKGLLQAAARRVERWRRVARESSQQSRRATLPQILEPLPLDRLDSRDFPWRFFLDEDPAAAPLVRALPALRPDEPVAILIGPEGGWTPAERQRLAADWRGVSLGGRILRAETAAIAALAILTNHWAGTG